MAVTLDKLGFSELIPGTSGTPLDGVVLIINDDVGARV